MENKDGEVGAMAKLTIVKIEKLDMGSMVDDSIRINFKSFFVDLIFRHKICVEKNNRFRSLKLNLEFLS